MDLQRYYQMKISPAVAMAVIAVFCGLLAEMLSYVGERNYFIITTVLFGLIVSWMVASVFKKRTYSLLVGSVFGFYMGLIYAEDSLVSLRYSGQIRFGFLLAVIFVLVGVSLSVYLESLLHLVFPRRRPGHAPAAAPARPERPPATPRYRLRAPAMIIVIVLLLAATTMIQFVYFEKDWAYVYLVMAFDLAVALVALVLTNIRFFFWLAGVTLGFFLATLIVAGSLVDSYAWVELVSGLTTGIFFTVLGSVVGLLAQSVDSLHKLIHEAAAEEG